MADTPAPVQHQYGGQSAGMVFVTGFMNRFLHQCRSLREIGAMIDIAQSGWWFGIFGDCSDGTILADFPQSDQLFHAAILVY